jgi:hypothetical protein
VIAETVLSWALLGPAAAVALVNTLDTLMTLIDILRKTFTNRAGRVDVHKVAVILLSTVAADAIVALVGWLVLR